MRQEHRRPDLLVAPPDGEQGEDLQVEGIAIGDLVQSRVGIEQLRIVGSPRPTSRGLSHESEDVVDQSPG
jgi:hypothetical protein